MCLQNANACGKLLVLGKENAVSCTCGHTNYDFSSLGPPGTGCKGVEKLPEAVMYLVKQEALDSMQNTKTKNKNHGAYNGI